MQLHQIRADYRNKSKKRIGRGGKRGTYSGRGQKGQKARAGRVIKPHQREISLRLPKKRGFQNKPKETATFPVKMGSLNKIESKTIDLKTLIESGLVSKKSKSVKIVNGGTIDSAKEIIGIPCSKSVKEAIIKAGGKVS